MRRLLDPLATVGDVDLNGQNFDGGSLTIDFTAGSDATDRLGISPVGDATGEINVNWTSKEVKYGGVAIGTIIGGTDNVTPLVISFNSTIATPTAAQALIQRVTYMSVVPLPAEVTRTIRIVVNDGDGGTSSSTPVLYNMMMNNPPVPQNDRVSLYRNSSVTIDVLSNDTDRENDPLTIVSVSAASMGSVRIVSNQLYYQSGSVWGSDTLYYTITDGKDHFVSAQVIVDTVHDYPQVSSLSEIIIKEDNESRFTFTVTDRDTSYPTINLTSSNNSILDGNKIIKSQYGNTWTLTIAPEKNQSGVTQLTIDVSDGTLSVSKTILVIVQEVNDPPSFTKGSDIVVNMNSGSQTLYGWASNISPGPANESHQLCWFVVGTENRELFEVLPSINSSGDLTFTPAANKHGMAVVSVFVSDDGGVDHDGKNTGDRKTFTITVSDPAAPVPTTTVTNTPIPSATIIPTSTPESTSTVTPAVETVTPTAVATPSVEAVTPTATATFGLIPSRTPSLTSTPVKTKTPSPTATKVATATPTRTLTPVKTKTPSPTATKVVSATPSRTTAPVKTNTPSSTATKAATVTPTRTSTPVKTNTPSSTATKAATATPTATNVSTLVPTATNTPVPAPEFIPPTVSAQITDDGLLIEWNYSSQNPAISQIHIYVNDNGQDILIEGINNIDKYNFMSKAANGKSISYLWKVNSPELAGPYLTGPQANHTYTFRIYFLTDSTIPQVYGPYQTESILYNPKNNYTPTMTPAPEPTATLTPVIIPPVFVVKATEEGLLITWNYAGSNVDINDVQSIHLYVNDNNEDIRFDGLNNINGYNYLGMAQDGTSLSFLWKANGARTSVPYRTGPQANHSYKFQIYYLTTSGTPHHYGPFQTQSVLYIPVAAPTPTPTVTPIALHGLVSESTDSLIITWDHVDTKLFKDCHVYVKVNNGDTVDGAYEMESYYFLGNTNDATTTFFRWSSNRDDVSGALKPGPVPGTTYSFRLYLLTVSGLPVFYGPVQLIDNYTYKPGAVRPTPTPIPPTPTPYPLKSDPGVFSFQDNDNAVVYWNLSDQQLNQSDLKDIHIYVKINDGALIPNLFSLDGYYYLGHASALSKIFTWKKNAVTVSPAFRNGPFMNTKYEFAVYLRTIRIDSKIYGPYKTKEPLILLPDLMATPTPSMTPKPVISSTPTVTPTATITPTPAATLKP